MTHPGPGSGKNVYIAELSPHQQTCPFDFQSLRQFAGLDRMAGIQPMPSRKCEKTAHRCLDHVPYQWLMAGDYCDVKMGCDRSAMTEAPTCHDTQHGAPVKRTYEMPGAHAGLVWRQGPASRIPRDHAVTVTNS